MFLKKTGSVEIIGITYFGGIYESNPLSPPQRGRQYKGACSLEPVRGHQTPNRRRESLPIFDPRF
jgi:hypothetical protein